MYLTKLNRCTSWIIWIWCTCLDMIHWFTMFMFNLWSSEHYGHLNIMLYERLSKMTFRNSSITLSMEWPLHYTVIELFIYYKTKYLKIQFNLMSWQTHHLMSTLKMNIHWQWHWWFWLWNDCAKIQLDRKWNNNMYIIYRQTTTLFRVWNIKVIYVWV